VRISSLDIVAQESRVLRGDAAVMQTEYSIGSILPIENVGGGRSTKRNTDMCSTQGHQTILRAPKQLIEN
jgi:hypothetical protein